MRDANATIVFRASKATSTSTHGHVHFKVVGRVYGVCGFPEISWYRGIVVSVVRAVCPSRLSVRVARSLVRDVNLGPIYGIFTDYRLPTDGITFPFIRPPRVPLTGSFHSLINSFLPSVHPIPIPSHSSPLFVVFSLPLSLRLFAYSLCGTPPARPLTPPAHLRSLPLARSLTR